MLAAAHRLAFGPIYAVMIGMWRNPGLSLALITAFAELTLGSSMHWESIYSSLLSNCCCSTEAARFDADRSGTFSICTLFSTKRRILHV